MPLIFVVSMGTIAATKMVIGSAVHLAVTFTILIVVVGGLYYLYRMLVTPIADFSVRLRSTSISLSSTASQSAATATVQSSMAAQISTTVEEIARTSEASSKSAKEIVTVSANALEQSNEGQKSVQETLDIMVEIANVVQVVDLINNLAEQSREATKEIAAAIERTSQGQLTARRTRASIEKLSETVKDASDRSRAIAGAAVQQETGIEQINEAANALSQTSRETAEVTRNVEQTAEDMETISKQLLAFVGGKTVYKSLGKR